MTVGELLDHRRAAVHKLGDSPAGYVGKTILRFSENDVYLQFPSSEDDKEFPVFENNISEQENVELKQIEGFTLFRR